MEPQNNQDRWSRVPLLGPGRTIIEPGTRFIRYANCYLPEGQYMVVTFEQAEDRRIFATDPPETEVR